MPMGQYRNFAECVRKNSDKKNPEAYCGAIKHAVEGKKKMMAGDMMMEEEDRKMMCKKKCSTRYKKNILSYKK